MTRSKFIPLQAAVQANAFALAACAGSSDDQSADSAHSASGVEGPDGVPPLSQVQGPDIPLAEVEDLPGTLLMLQDVGLT